MLKRVAPGLLLGFSLTLACVTGEQECVWTADDFMQTVEETMQAVFLDLGGTDETFGGVEVPLFFGDSESTGPYEETFDFSASNGPTVQLEEGFAIGVLSMNVYADLFGSETPPTDMLLVVWLPYCGFTMDGEPFEHDSPVLLMAAIGEDGRVSDDAIDDMEVFLPSRAGLAEPVEGEVPPVRFEVLETAGSAPGAPWFRVVLWGIAEATFMREVPEGGLPSGPRTWPKDELAAMTGPPSDAIGGSMEILPELNIWLLGVNFPTGEPGHESLEVAVGIDNYSPTPCGSFRVRLASSGGDSVETVAGLEGYGETALTLTVPVAETPLQFTVEVDCFDEIAEHGEVYGLRSRQPIHGGCP